MFYALVDGLRRAPAPESRGVCPVCGDVVIARCGEHRTWHWAHRARADCDAWAEPVGPWHRGWQSLARPESVEVTLGLHRADIVGDDGVVIELQHSPIHAAVIGERERYYGRMVWLFDATGGRWPMLVSGPRVFFALGGATSVATCREPVVLDCGATLVEVEAFTTALGGLSGFGMLRERRWFVERYLRETVLHPVSAMTFPPAEARSEDAWPERKPYRLMEQATDWLDDAGNVVRLPSGTPYLPADQEWASPRLGRLPVWCEVIDRHAELAGGWTRGDFRAMKALFGASARILAGRLRLVPRPVHELSPPDEAVAEDWLAQAEGHLRAGRLPLL